MRNAQNNVQLVGKSGADFDAIFVVINWFVFGTNNWFRIKIAHTKLTVSPIHDCQCESN